MNANVENSLLQVMHWNRPWRESCVNGDVAELPSGTPASESGGVVSVIDPGDPHG